MYTIIKYPSGNLSLQLFLPSTCIYTNYYQIPFLSSLPSAVSLINLCQHNYQIYSFSCFSNQSISIHNYQIPFWKSLPSAVSPINLYLQKLLSNTLLEFSPFSSFSHQPMSTQLPNLSFQLFLQSTYVYTIIK